MAVKSKQGAASSKRIIVSRPKKTLQGAGQHSKPNHGRKKPRGQGH